MKNLSHMIKTKYLRFSIFCLGILIGILGFEEIVDDVFFDPLEGDLESQVFDHSILKSVDKFRSPMLTEVMRDLTALGSFSVIITLFIIFSAHLLVFRDRKGLAYLSLIFVGAGGIPALLKLYFMRTRPDVAEHLVTVLDYSFPSGHTFAATSIYIALGFYSSQFTRKWYQEVFFYSLCFLVILMVGTSRIYLGVHYPTDVLAGISSGMIWAFLISAIFEFHAQRKTN